MDLNFTSSKSKGSFVNSGGTQVAQIYVIGAGGGGGGGTNNGGSGGGGSKWEWSMVR